jgi:hypothetical protein
LFKVCPTYVLSLKVIRSFIPPSVLPFPIPFIGEGYFSPFLGCPHGGIIIIHVLGFGELKIDGEREKDKKTKRNIERNDRKRMHNNK